MSITGVDGLTPLLATQPTQATQTQAAQEESATSFSQVLAAQQTVATQGIPGIIVEEKPLTLDESETTILEDGDAAEDPADPTATPATTATAAAAATAQTAANSGAVTADTIRSLLPALLGSSALGSSGMGGTTGLLMMLALLGTDDASNESSGGLNFSLISTLLAAGMNTSAGLFGSGTSGTGSAMAASQTASLAAMIALGKAFANKGDTSTLTANSLSSGNNLQALLNWRGSNATASSSTMDATQAQAATRNAEVSPAGAILPRSGGRPVTFAVTSNASDRSAARYRAVIEQLNVKESGRYEVNKYGNDDTYCNIYLWDVTSAMGAEIPHYTDPDTGDIVTYPNTEGAIQMNANRTYDWLEDNGARYGWYEVTEEQAQALANAGHPAVTAWKNTSGGHGHVQVVSPSVDGQYSAARGPAIAQAGTRLTDYTYQRTLFSTDRAGTKYFAHI